MKSELNETELQILVIYLTQMLGVSTAKKIKNVMIDKMGIKANKIEIVNALNSAKKRGIVSVNHIQDPETGNTIDGYSMKDVRFANPPEIAHIKNVLPVLLEDELSKKMFNDMDEVHDKGEKKGGRLPDIRDYKSLTVTFRNVLPILGGQPNDGNQEDEVKNTLRRIGDKIWIPANLWLRASIRDKLRQYNINESKILYVDINDYFFIPKKPIVQVVCPSPAQRKGGAGTGLTTYEALQPDEELIFTIKFPITNGISESIMRSILSDNIRIGAKAKDYGLLEVKSITII